jgi:hypothetical protein
MTQVDFEQSIGAKITEAPETDEIGRTLSNKGDFRKRLNIVQTSKGNISSQYSL